MSDPPAKDVTHPYTSIPDSVPTPPDSAAVPPEPQALPEPIPPLPEPLPPPRRRPRRRIRLFLPAALAAAVVAVVLPYLPHHHDQQQISRIDGYLPLITRYAEHNSLPVDFVCDVIRAESGGDPRAVSRVGARGLMQIMAGAEADVLGATGGEKGDLFDPEYNIAIGTAYLRMLADRFDADAYLVLAAYNMGPTRVAKLRQQYPDLSSMEFVDTHAYKETRRYCRKILKDGPLQLPSPP